MSACIRASRSGLGPPHWIGTFHGLHPNFDILDADESRRLVRRTMMAMSLGSDAGGPTGRDPVKLTCQRIGKFKDSVIAPEEAASRVDGMIAAAIKSAIAIDTPGLRQATKIYVEYQRRLREANVAASGDLLLWPILAM